MCEFCGCSEPVVDVERAPGKLLRELEARRDEIGRGLEARRDESERGLEELELEKVEA